MFVDEEKCKENTRKGEKHGSLRKKEKKKGDKKGRRKERKKKPKRKLRKKILIYVIEDFFVFCFYLTENSRKSYRKGNKISITREI